MADALYNIIEQNPTTGLAVGGAIVAAAVGFTAVKALSGGKSAPETSTASKKKKKSKAAKKKATADTTSDVEKPAAAQVEAPKINLDDFVADYPDTEDEEAARAEKKKLKRKLKKKKSKTNGSSDAAADVAAKKNAFSADALKDAEDGWETVSRKKSSKAKQN